MAGNGAASEPGYKFLRNHYSYIINPDGTFSTTIEIQIKVLKEDSLEGARQQEISYSTSVEKVEVIEAYTKKENGQRVDVPKSNFQFEVNSGKDSASPAFSDRTNLTIIFPEVAVGDTVHWKYKLSQTEPLFPNHFSEWRTFPKYHVYEDVQIKVDIPSSMLVRYKLTGLTESESAQKNGHRIFSWAYQNRQHNLDKNDWGNIYYFGKDPGYIISTFPSYASIAHAYGVRAKQKAIVTGRIQKLADEITKEKSKPYDQAKALYEWVSDNITYAGNCIGVGAVVPRDTDFVLDNRMGDCKDHSTLLEALLTAKNIASTQALINSGSIYDLPDIPVVSTVNHVLNYLPGLNIYVDSTSDNTPFGVLPDSESGKPVLLVDGYQEGQKTPVPSEDNNSTKTQAELSVGENGSAKGKVSWINKGRLALYSNTQATFKKYRKFMDDKEKVEEYSKSMIKKYGFEAGKVSFSLDEFPKSPDVATTEITFEVKDFLNGGSLGAFNINPVFSNSQVVSTLKSIAAQEDPSSDFYCKGAHFEETYIYSFPKNIKILAVPDDAEISNALVAFKATYVLNENTLTVVRRVDDFTQGPVCKRETYRYYREVADKAIPNLKSQVVYKYTNL